jgi:hypothetical protein
LSITLIATARPDLRCTPETYTKHSQFPFTVVVVVVVATLVVLFLLIL